MESGLTNGSDMSKLCGQVIIVTTCVIVAGVLAYAGVPYWGWFLAIAVLVCA